MAHRERIKKLQENVYAVRGTWMPGISFINTYCYVLISEINGEILIFDTCGPGSGGYIRDAVEAMGRDVREITGIAFSHWHRDHTGSLAEIVQMAGKVERPVKIFMHKLDAPSLMAQRYRLITIHPLLKFKVPHRPGALPPAGLYELVELDHESGINPLEEYGVEFMHMPGHTEGHTSYFYRKSKALFSGCGISMIGESAAGIVPICSSRSHQVESAKRLAEMEFDYLYPAHLYVRGDLISRERRIPFTGEPPLLNRITGALPIFRYPRD